MILVVCSDDPGLVTIAQNTSQSDTNVFGNYYQIYNPIPTLGPAENLFVIAHGSYLGDDNNPVIGDEEAAFYVNAVEFWENIKSIFPRGYTGSVYIDACEAADHDLNTFSFTEVFLTQIQVAYGSTLVYGKNGISDSALVTPPGDASWTQATL